MSPLNTHHSSPVSNAVLDLDTLQHQILKHVHKPGRYLGLEHGAYRKPLEQARVTMAMIFPDLYEIGVSNTGHKMLYSLVNNQDGYLCDRAYAPAKDMMAKLKDENIPLYGIESLLPLKDFDLLAFTLQYELNYTSILGVLESAQLPFRTADRAEDAPVLIAGGPGSANPMPLAPFFDAFIIGDGEEVLLELMAVLDTANQEGWTNTQRRETLATIEGIFVPGVNTGARKRIVDITQQYIDVAPLIPHIQSVHDRVVVEARRGCDRMCRFCQPCFINLPVREQSVDRIKTEALAELAKTGYEECSLLSLSIADYSQLKPLITDVSEALKEKKASLSLPSQRADRFDIEIAEAVQAVRKSTLTFAPEAGTERLRAVINKNLTEAEILKAVTESYRAGWNKVKLYFMIGLPSETDKDLVGIVQLVQKMKAACADIQREPGVSLKKGLEVNVTLSNFVPKPHTPFQWVGQDTLDELARKIAFLKDAFRGVKGCKLNFTDPEISKLECLISKGDERMAAIIEKAYLKGAYLDAWEEHMTFPQWFEALNEVGIDADEFTKHAYTKLDEPLPWDGLNEGLEKSWLQDEYRKSLEEQNSDPCFIGCSTCGVCTTLSVQPVFMPASAIATRKQHTEKESKDDYKARVFPPPSNRYRLQIQKAGDLRYISHLDWLRMIHRALTRAEIPVAYSQGFNPSPRVSFGPALPLFVEGLAEYIDLDTVQPIAQDQLIARLNPQLPKNGQITGCSEIPVHSASLDKLVTHVVYQARQLESYRHSYREGISSDFACNDSGMPYTVSEVSQRFLARPTVEIEVDKKGITKRLDIKPNILDFRMVSESTVQFTLRVDRQEMHIKPDWVVQELDPSAQWLITRTLIGFGDVTSTSAPGTIDPNQVPAFS
jgi:radical SAM-linked protein